jgi:hypothetical protein
MVLVQFQGRSAKIKKVSPERAKQNLIEYNKHPQFQIDFSSNLGQFVSPFQGCWGLSIIPWALPKAGMLRPLTGQKLLDYTLKAQHQNSRSGSM